MQQLGFHVWSVGGVSRAWRKFFSDGGYVLVTDIGGFDLPGESGPYQAARFNAADEMRELQTVLESPVELVRWLGRHEASEAVQERVPHTDRERQP